MRLFIVAAMFLGVVACGDSSSGEVGMQPGDVELGGACAMDLDCSSASCHDGVCRMRCTPETQADDCPVPPTTLGECDMDGFCI